MYGDSLRRDVPTRGYRRASYLCLKWRPQYNLIARHTPEFVLKIETGAQ
jgi:hypothetical protein